MWYVPTGGGLTPAIVGGVSHPTDTSSNTSVTNTAFSMPFPAYSGQSAIAAVTSEDSPITNLTVTDDKSDICTEEVDKYDGGSPTRVLALYVCPSLTAGAQNFTLSENTGGGYDQMFVFYVNNLLASSFMNGTCSATVTSGTSLTCGSGITTTAANDLVIGCSFVNTWSTTPVGSMTFTAASGFTLLPPDGTSWMGCQYEVQNSAGTVIPTMTVTYSSAHVTRATTVAIAVKVSASARGSVPSGVYANYLQVISQNAYSNQPSGTAFTIQAPCLPGTNGIAIAEMAENDATTISDGTNSFTGRGSWALNADTAYGIRFWTADKITCTAAESITITASVTNTGGVYYVLEIAGETNGYDSTAGATGTGSGNNTSTSFPINLSVASITPSTSGGLILGCINSQNQTVSGMDSSGYGMQIVLTPSSTYQGLLMDQDGGFLVFQNNSTSAYTPTYIYTKSQSGETDIAAWWNQTIAIY